MIKNILQSSLIRSSSIYTLANILNSAIPFFLLPIMTVYLTPADYGIVSMFGTLLGFFAPFMSLNVYGAISRKYYDREDKFSRYISTALYIVLFSSLLVWIIIYLFRDFISRISSFPENALVFVVIAGFGNSITQITLTLWRVRERPIVFGIFQISQTLLNMIASIVLVVGFSMGWFGRVSGQVLANVVFGLIGFIIVVKNEKINFQWSKVDSKDMLQFGIPLIPHALGSFLMTMTDRVFITNMFGVSATGIYTVGYQIGKIIGLLQDSFNNAWIPFLFKKLKENNRRVEEKIVNFTYLYFIVIILMTVLLSLIAPFIVKIFIGESFHGSIQYVLWIALGYAFNGMYKMVSGVIFYEKKTHLLSTVTFITALLNIILNYVFIKANGAVGAAQATSVAYFISFILTWILSHKVHPMPWNIFKSRKS